MQMCLAKDSRIGMARCLTGLYDISVPSHLRTVVGFLRGLIRVAAHSSPTTSPTSRFLQRFSEHRQEEVGFLTPIPSPDRVAHKDGGRGMRRMHNAPT